MISIFTPTNDTRWLLELWASLWGQQGDVPFEWIIGLNGGAVPIHLGNDSRIRWCNLSDFNGRGVGALKRALCNECAVGEILLEVDHDDVLAPTALLEVQRAFDDPEVGFVYSDFVEFEDDNPPRPFVYDMSHGWAHYSVEFRGVELQAMRAFEPSARSLCEIYYAPNHLRAWRRGVYKTIGGHDAQLSVGDDHDLVCRTYVATRFHHIPKPLYFYRRRADGGNTYLRNFAAVQKQSKLNRDKYLDRLVERWCQLSGLRMLDLGGALNAAPGWETVDRDGADINCDVEDYIPVEPGTVGAFRAFDFLEHLRNPVKVMNDLHRRLAPGGWLLSLTPSSEGLGAFCDLTHRSYWNELSWRYFTRQEFARYYTRHDPPVHGAWQQVRLERLELEIGPPQRFVPYVRSDLCTLKGQRGPGEVFW